MLCQRQRTRAVRCDQPNVAPTGTSVSGTRPADYLSMWVLNCDLMGCRDARAQNFLPKRRGNTNRAKNITTTNA